MTLLICLPSFSIYLFIILIPAYVYLTCMRISLLFHIRTHFSPFSYVLFVLYSILTTMFLSEFCFFRNLIDTCVTVSIDVTIPLLIS